MMPNELINPVAASEVLQWEIDLNAFVGRQPSIVTVNGGCSPGVIVEVEKPTHDCVVDDWYTFFQASRFNVRIADTAITRWVCGRDLIGLEYAPGHSRKPVPGGDEMSQDEERAVSALIGAGRTLNAWREPIHAAECELNISMAEARALVEVLQHRGLVRVKRERTSGFPRLHWWIRGCADPATKRERKKQRANADSSSWHFSPAGTEKAAGG
jgi:hypothetical protein